MDDRHWTSRSPDAGATLEAPGLTIACAADGGAALISGDMDAAIAALAPGAPMLGLLDACPDGPHALRIARDRALLVTPAPLWRDGWQGTYAVSAADDLFLKLTITGPRAGEIGAACMSAARGSASASTLFAGHGALVVSVANGLCVRVQRPEAAALWAHCGKLVTSL
jgi:hypothetical protein